MILSSALFWLFQTTGIAKYMCLDVIVMYCSRHIEFLATEENRV